MSGLNKEFNEWWRSDVLLKDNPYSIRTPKYWAWEGWVAGLNAEREACAVLCDAHKNPIDDPAAPVGQYESGGYIMAEFLADAIRARG